MVASIREVLSTRVTVKAISQVAASTNRLLNLFNMQPGGSAERSVGHRQFGYDIFNNAREVAQFRAPGASAATRRRQAVGRVDGTFPRMNEKLFLLAEDIFNQRRVGGPANEFDEAGQDYIRRQQRYMGQLAANWRAVLLGGMLRGALYLHGDGDDLYADYTSTSAVVTVDFQVPSGNKNQCNMLGAGNIVTGSFANPSTDIPSIIAGIDVGFQKLCGQRADLAICDNAMWQRLIKNDFVVSEGGAFQTPFETFNRVAGEGPDGTPLVEKRGRLRAIPWLDWIITDEGLKLGTQGSESYTSFVPANNIFFLPNPNPDLFEMLLGSEAVIEGPTSEAQTRMGLHAWTTPSFDPSGWTLFTLDNAMPALYVPNALVNATVVF